MNSAVQWVAPRLVQRELGITRSTLNRWRDLGLIEALPPARKRGHWRYDLRGYVERRKANSTDTEVRDA